MKSIKTILKSIVLTTLLGVTANAADWHETQINLLESGIVQLEKQIAEQNAHITACQANMSGLSLDEALGKVPVQADKRRRDQELQRNINAALEKINRYQGQISDNKRAIQRYREEQRRQQGLLRRQQLRW